MSFPSESGFFHEWKKQKSRLMSFFKWGVISSIIGIIVGLVGTGFYYGMQFVTKLRVDYPVIIWGLPFAGLLIVFMYRITKQGNDTGTNGVIAAIRSESTLGFITVPLIFISTLITHLFGGSAGREGAALQMGGGIGNSVGKALHLNEKDVHIAVMCGMSACFAALFGTPIAASFFAMEVVSVGVMYYAALVPCVFAALIASGIAHALGVGSEAMTILNIPAFTPMNAWKIAVLAILCAAMSIFFCILLHSTSKYSKKWLPNPYIRIFLTGALIAVIHLLTGGQDYMGAGMEVIEHAVHGQTRPEAFLLKMLLTALTLGVGYKGGEIVPSFFIGATFGCLMGQFFGISPAMCAAVGMISLFCGVTNSPVTSLLLGFELFGGAGIHFILIGIAVSYMLSGYYSLYDSQKIMYSKYDAEYRGHKWKGTK